MKVADVARRQEVGLGELLEASGVDAAVPADVLVTVELELKYEGYFARERVQAERLQRMGELRLPGDLAYDAMLALSFEARQKLAALRPRTLAQAARVPGVSPTDLQNLAVELDRRRRMG